MVSPAERRGHYETVQILNDDGTVREDATVPDIPDETLIGIYRDMVLARHLDERVISLQRQGRIGTYTPLAGQEGAQIGSVHALDDHDWLVPSFREHGAKIARGLEPEKIMMYWGGYEEANKIPEELNMFTEAIPVGSQIPHATGIAWAAKLKGDNSAVLCYFGDGATSEGDFHEGLNFAGVFDVPAVFFCNNNQWAISIPFDRQSASQTIAQKATAYGFEGVLVDGMDPLASYKVTRDALEKAKNPSNGEQRPTLIEAVQYRFEAHTTADDPSVYRDSDEVERWKQKDPIPRLETYLRDRGLLDDETVASINAEVEASVAEAIEIFEEFETNTDQMFEHVFEELPARVRSQQQKLNRLREKYGDSAFQRE